MVVAISSGSCMVPDVGRDDFDRVFSEGGIVTTVVWWYIEDSTKDCCVRQL